MTFFQFSAPTGFANEKFDYPTLGFFATNGAILDGTASNPQITAAPDAHWTVVASGPESGITRYRQPQTPPDDQSSWDGSLLVYDATTRAFVRKAPSDAIASGTGLGQALDTAIGAQAVGKTAPGADVLSTADAAALQPWYAALAQRDWQRAIMACIGTSRTEGGPGVTASSRRWVNRLTANLRALYPLTTGQPAGSTGYLPCFYKSFNGGGTSTGAIAGTVKPTGVTYSGTSYPLASFGWGARSVELVSSADWIEFAFTGTGADVFISSRTIANSTGTYTVDGGAAQTLPVPAATNTAAALSVRGLAAGSHTVRIIGATGQVDVAGIYPYNGDESKGIHVIESGKGSAQAKDVLNQASYKSFATLMPSLITVEFGYNEYFNNVVPATFQTNLQTLVTNALSQIAEPPTVLFLKLAQPSATNPAYPYSAYMDAVDAVAASTANSLVLDFANRVPGYNPDTYGYWYSDKVHNSDAGAGFQADVLTKVLSPR